MTPWFKKGDIILLMFNNAKGHEQSGYRPAVVASDNSYSEATGMVGICPVTRTIRTDYKLQVELPENVENYTSIKTIGVIRCDQFKTIDPYERHIKVVGHINDERCLSRITAAVMQILVGIA